jgi:glycosyltransferase involved in cell wall biosynthesis
MDYSSVPEVVGPAGQLVPVHHLLDNMYSCFWALPDEEEFARQLDFLVSHPMRRRELGRLGPAHVAAKFSWKQAAASFAALMPVAEAVA